MNDDTNTATLNPPASAEIGDAPLEQPTGTAIEIAGETIPFDREAFEEATGRRFDPNVPTAAERDQAELERKAAAFAEIAEAERAVALAEAEMESAKEAAKEKKAKWENASLALHRLIREHRDPQPPTLFDQAAKPTADGSLGENDCRPDVDPDQSWRDIPLDVALPDLSEAVLAKLYKANLHTMGELADWTGADGGRHRLSDLDGIGSGTAGKIEEATMAFWARRPVQDVLEVMTEPDPPTNGQPHEPLLDRDRLILEAVSKEQEDRDALHALKQTGATDGQIRLIIEKALAGNQAGACSPGSWSVHDGKKLKLSLPGQQTETLSINGVAKAIRRILEIPKA